MHPPPPPTPLPPKPLPFSFGFWDKFIIVGYQLARAQLKVMIVISARPFEEYFETVPKVREGRALEKTPASSR